jgi:hypothetical protein
MNELGAVYFTAQTVARCPLMVCNSERIIHFIDGVTMLKIFLSFVVFSFVSFPSFANSIAPTVSYTCSDLYGSYCGSVGPQPYSYYVSQAATDQASCGTTSSCVMVLSGCYGHSGQNCITQTAYSRDLALLTVYGSPSCPSGYLYNSGTNMCDSVNNCTAGNQSTLSVRALDTAGNACNSAGTGIADNVCASGSMFSAANTYGALGSTDPNGCPVTKGSFQGCTGGTAKGSPSVCTWAATQTGAAPTVTQSAAAASAVATANTLATVKMNGTISVVSDVAATAGAAATAAAAAAGASSSVAAAAGQQAAANAAAAAVMNTATGGGGGNGNNSTAGPCAADPTIDGCQHTDTTNYGSPGTGGSVVVPASSVSGVSGDLVNAASSVDGSGGAFTGTGWGGYWPSNSGAGSCESDIYGASGVPSVTLSGNVVSWDVCTSPWWVHFKEALDWFCAMLVAVAVWKISFSE